MQRTLERLIDRATPRHERIIHRFTRGIASPGHITVLRLHRYDKINRPLHSWKQSLEECSIFTNQKVVPYPGSNVSDVIGFAPGDIGWRAINVRRPPTAII